MADKEFVNGLRIEKPKAGAPAFVIAKGGIQIKEFLDWLEPHVRAKEKWVNFQILESRKGTWYAAVDDWKPDRREEPAPKKDADFNDDIPF